MIIQKLCQRCPVFQMERIVKWMSYIAGTTVCPSGTPDRDLNTLKVSVYNTIKAFGQVFQEFISKQVSKHNHSSRLSKNNLNISKLPKQNPLGNRYPVHPSRGTSPWLQG